MNAEREFWMIWDTNADLRASVATFGTQQSAQMQIESWIERQAKGGRPDVDATCLEPRKLS